MCEVCIFYKNNQAKLWSLGQFGQIENERRLD